MTFRSACCGALLLPSLALLVSSCRDSDYATGSADPPVRFNIVDAPRSAAGSGFYFLPPLVPQPQAFTGAFDATAAPVVDICVPIGGACQLPLIARFTMAGTGSTRVRVDAAAEHYIVNWHTRSHTLDPAKTYRIRVRVGGSDLGYADVRLVRNAHEARSIDATRYVAVILGSTQPIVFRIEQGAVPPAGTPHVLVDPSVARSATIGATGGSVSLTHDGIHYTFTVPAGALRSDQLIRMSPIMRIHNLPFEGGLAAGVQFEPEGLTFRKPAMLRMEFPVAVDARTITGLSYARDGDDMIPYPRFLDGNTVTLPIHHFSGAGAVIGSATAAAAAVRATCTATHYTCEERAAEAGIAAAQQEAAVQGVDAAPAIAAVLSAWSAEVQAELGEATGGGTLDEIVARVERALERSERWIYAGQSHGVDGLLTSEIAGVRAAQASMIMTMIDELDLQCRATSVVELRALAMTYADLAETQLALNLPSPYASGEVAIWHCADVRIESIELALPLRAGDAETVHIRAGVAYANGPISDGGVRLNVTLGGTTTDGLHTDAPAALPITVAQGASQVTVSVQACMHSTEYPSVNSRCDTDSNVFAVTPEITINVTPDNGTVMANQPFTFSATVTGTSNQQVTWSADGGTITDTGVFTAATPGLYTITGTSVADPSKKDTGTVQVTPAVGLRVTTSCTVAWAEVSAEGGGGSATIQKIPEGTSCDPRNVGINLVAGGSTAAGTATSTLQATVSLSGADSDMAQHVTMTGTHTGNVLATGTEACWNICASGTVNMFLHSNFSVEAVGGAVAIEVTLSGTGTCGPRLQYEAAYGVVETTVGNVSCDSPERTTYVVLAPGETIAINTSTTVHAQAASWPGGGPHEKNAVASYDVSVTVVPIR
ncbi:MAG TPA: hypothetical protein VMN60_00615 [Longimicrobiales bacterium]|nr:hypothetical protein [Longimicrobiales bacterium]